MKTWIKNVLATTGLALILLGIVALMFQGRFLCIETVFQVLVSCIIIHLILILLKRFESKYIFIELLAEIGCTLAVLIISGIIFRWFESIPVWVLVVMGILVYVIGCMIDMFQITRDVNHINKTIQKRKEQMSR